MVRPLRRHAAFIVCYTGPNAAASRNGNEQARRHERRESAFPLPPPRPPPAARPAPTAAHSPRGAGGGAVSRFAIVALSSRLATKTPGALCSVSTLTASSFDGVSPIG